MAIILKGNGVGAFYINGIEIGRENLVTGVTLNYSSDLTAKGNFTKVFTLSPEQLNYLKV